MKYFLIILLLMAVLITAGCAGTKDTKYVVGDIVWTSGDNYNPTTHRFSGVHIVSVGLTSYTVDFVFKNDGETHWYRLYPEDKITSERPTFEKGLVKVDHVEESTITTLYSSKAEYTAATSRTTPMR